MLRKIYFHIGYRLTLLTQQKLLKSARCHIMPNRIGQRFLCTPLSSSNAEYIKENDDCFKNESSQFDNCLGIDSDLTEPYVERNHTILKDLHKALKTVYKMNLKEVDSILEDKWVLTYAKTRCLIYTLEELKRNNIPKQSLLDYPWLLALESVRLKEKINVLSSLHSLQDLNDFVAFLRLQLPRLREIISAMNIEAPNVPFGNRAYYIAKKLNVEPYLANKYLARRLFVLLMPWNMFDENLNHMLAYKLESINILKDLWSFRYRPKAVENRLKRAQRAKRDKLMPWMIRCTESTLEKTLKLTIDEQKILGDKSTIAEYLAERLNFSVAEAQAIMNRHTQVKTVRVTKIKEVLDYLIDEEGFTNVDIAQTPRILCHGLETTKQRIEELKKYGCRPTSLVIVCRSKKQYELFLRNWIDYCEKVKAKAKRRDENDKINKLKIKAYTLVLFSLLWLLLCNLRYSEVKKSEKKKRRKKKLEPFLSIVTLVHLFIQMI